MSGGRLVDETIESVTEYFKSLYNIKKSNGKLKFQLEQRERKQSEAGMTTKWGTWPTKAVPHAVAIIATIAIVIAVTNRLTTVTKNATSPSEKLRRSFLVNLATPMATRPSTPTRSVATTPKIASRAVAITTTTTTGSATMTRTTMTNATLVAKMSLRTTIVRQNRATMMERNWAQAAETASATKKITMLILVKCLKKRGRSVWSKGLHLVRGIFEMRSHLIPRSMWHPHYFKMSLTKIRALWKSKKNLVTSRIRLPSNDAPHQWNLGKLYQSQVC